MNATRAAVGDRGQSLVLAVSYRVADPARMWRSLERRKAELEFIGAHHVVLYDSVHDPHHIFMTVGIHHRRSIPELLRTPVVFEWFTKTGADAIPAVFAGEMVAKIRSAPSDPSVPPGVVLGAFGHVDDMTALLGQIQSASDEVDQAGVRQTWIYGALDDRRETLILQELAADRALSWINDPGQIAVRMSRARQSAYHPPLFVGRFSRMMTIAAEH